MKYYVLGTKNNTMLEGYLEQYYEKLKINLKELLDFLKKAKSEKEKNLSVCVENLLVLGNQNKNFVLDGDNSSIINLLHLECVEKVSQGLGEYNFYADKLQREIELFLDRKSGMLVMNQGTIIAGTNIRLSCKDNNPYGKMDAHPEHKYNGGVQGWGEKSKEEWLHVYEKTFNVLKKVDEGCYDELNTIITKIIPLGTAENIHNSASYSECIGHLYMGYTINAQNPELNNLEAIIHESSHNKLNLIKQFDPLILNNLDERYYSPYRPDARHMSGIYLGIHAFVPVIYILMKVYHHGSLDLGTDWLEKLTLYYIKNKFSLRVLKKHGHFTQLGNEILDEVIEVMKLTDIVFQKINPDVEIIKTAKTNQTKHFHEVNEKYSCLEY